MLRGGDHGVKTAAERRFRMKDGPRVLVCTAAPAVRASISSLPASFSILICPGTRWIWSSVSGASIATARHISPKSIISFFPTRSRGGYSCPGRQAHRDRPDTGVDDHGNAAEDFRAQILGQLSERLNYDRVYQEALSDPTLQRTTVELEAALSNAREAREVVFDLFRTSMDSA